VIAKSYSKYSKTDVEDVNLKNVEGSFECIERRDVLKFKFGCLD